jgi:hypothetical protein
MMPRNRQNRKVPAPLAAWVLFMAGRLLGLVGRVNAQAVMA